MARPWQRIDPRRHLGAAIGWIVFTVVTLFAVGAGVFAASEAEDEVGADAERLLAQFAFGITQALTVNLETRLEIVRTTAERLSLPDVRAALPAQQQLEAVRRNFSAFAWLGIADASGKIVTATDDQWLGQDVSALPSVQRARQPASSAQPLVTVPQPRDPTEAESGSMSLSRAIEMAVPIRDSAGGVTGTLVAALSWAWFDGMTQVLVSERDWQHRLALDLLVISNDGVVLGGAPNWLGRRLALDSDLSEGGDYLIGRAVGADKVGLADWLVIVRQRADVVQARTRAIGRSVFFSVLLAGMLSAAVAMAFVRMLVRRLTRLSEQARAWQDGTSAQLTVPAGRDEISQIGATLASVVEQLQREKRALEGLNTELDQRVAERTARIERLADDARYAAVTRERLRIARDLHDTLAHSMMALLTQIRLVRKLHGRWSRGDLEDELARAEAVAASGLTEARAAIGQMRHNSVREVGLGPALTALIARFRERTGLVVELQIDPDAAKLADERVETAFRIIEEALHNVERHAQAQCVTIAVEATALPVDDDRDREHVQRIRLEVADDGIGFDPAELPLGHYGLRGMYEQAALIEAHLTMACGPGQGARIGLEFEV